jgi:hypothetical protein
MRYAGFGSQINPLILRGISEQADFHMKVLNWSEVGVNFYMRTKNKNEAFGHLVKT